MPGEQVAYLNTCSFGRCMYYTLLKSRQDAIAVGTARRYFLFAGVLNEMNAALKRQLVICTDVIRVNSLYMSYVGDGRLPLGFASRGRQRSNIAVHVAGYVDDVFKLISDRRF